MSEAAKTPRMLMYDLSTFSRADDYKELYANNTKITMSPWDLAVTFGLLSETSTGGVLKDFLSVRLSPHSFKILALAIPVFCRAWEHRFGEINVNPSSMVDLESLYKSLIGEVSAPAAPLPDAKAPKMRGRKAKSVPTA